MGLPELVVHASPAQMEVSASDQAEMKQTRMKRRVYDLIKQVWMLGGRGNTGRAVLTRLPAVRRVGCWKRWSRFCTSLCQGSSRIGQK